MVPAAILLLSHLEWAGLTSCLALKKGDVQFTDRLTQEKSQTREVTIVYTGEQGYHTPKITVSIGSSLGK